MDNLSITIVTVLGLFTLATVYFLIKAILEVFRQERIFAGNGVKGAIGFLFSLILMANLAYCVYQIPAVFFGGMSWPYITETGPMTLIAAVVSLSVAIPIFYLYFIFTTYFVKPNEKPYFLVIVLSIMSGLGNSLIIMVINETLNRNLYYLNNWVGIGSGLYLYFILGVLLFTISAMVVRKRLIKLNNDLVYEKRMEIIQKILNAPYHKLEAVEDGKINATLNNDTEVVSGFVNSLVGGLTGIITLISCLIYLGTINGYGLLASLFIIGLACALFLTVSKQVEKIWEKNRDIQNTFFKFLYYLTHGAKELYINRQKRAEFGVDIEESCAMYRKTRIDGENKFVGVGITGELLFIVVIGIVVFTFSIIFPSINGNTLRTYVLVYLYMGGIVNSQIYLIPGFIRVMISWRRINELNKELAALETDPTPIKNLTESEFTLQLIDVSFQYKNENGEPFSVGPITQTFHSGEIVFITGGNGSGKSTLAKLLTGLYPPDSGEIRFNGQKINSPDLGPYYSTIFSEYCLFEKLYGINYQTKEEEITRYLKLLRLDNKLWITDGNLSAITLSTGQRKRAALLVSYLEDQQILLFDEWAAEQDPEFRKLFYHGLLPELKSRGKLVIAITHDDRYYAAADRVLKMELGQIVTQFKGAQLSHDEVAGASIDCTVKN